MEEETITLEKKVLMDLISLTANMAVWYAAGMAPAMNDEGFLISIEKEINRGPLFNKEIPADLRQHILLVVNGFRQN